jgi:hypothetical protein
MIARHLAIVLRRLAKVLATINAFWVLIACLFQFGNYFDTCFCNSSLFGRGRGAFSTMDFSSRELIESTKHHWIEGVFFGGGTAFLFVVFVNVFIRSPLPRN